MLSEMDLEEERGRNMLDFLIQKKTITLFCLMNGAKQLRSEELAAFVE